MFRSATRIAMLLGVLMTLWSSIGVLFVPREEETAPPRCREPS